MGQPSSDEGCYCGHGPYHHQAGDWPFGPVNGRCCERGCDCSSFQRKAVYFGSSEQVQS